MKTYFRHGTNSHLGVPVPDTRIIAKKYQSLSLKDLKTLLHSKIHEECLLALFILVLQYGKSDLSNRKSIYEFYLENKDYVNNWDLVDSSAHYIVGRYLFEPDSGFSTRMTTLKKLAASENIWDRRIAIMSTFWFIKQKEFDDTLKISEILLDDTHDLVHKAVGWMLREVGNRDRSAEEKFLKKYYKQMPRTMLRYAIEKFPKPLYLAYLHGTI